MSTVIDYIPISDWCATVRDLWHTYGGEVGEDDPRRDHFEYVSPHVTPAALGRRYFEDLLKTSDLGAPFPPPAWADEVYLCCDMYPVVNLYFQKTLTVDACTVIAYSFAAVAVDTGVDGDEVYLPGDVLEASTNTPQIELRNTPEAMTPIEAANLASLILDMVNAVDR